MNIKFKILLLLPAFISMTAGSCKKEAQPPPFNYDEQRIESISDNGRIARFTYDEQKRLSRIDYNYDGNISVRFVYGSQTITAEYYNGAAPDPQRNKYTYTLMNGKIVNIHVAKPNGVVCDTYYDYDASDRMSEIGFRAISNGNLFSKLDCFFTYTQNNTQELRLYGANDSSPTDTVWQRRTYNDTKAFLTLSNVGFNYFGTFPTGISYRVSGLTEVVEPFPFFTSRPFVDNTPLIPSKKAIKKSEIEQKRRDLSDFTNNGWQTESGEWTDSDDDFSPYAYDEKGRLRSYIKYTIAWQ